MTISDDGRARFTLSGGRRDPPLGLMCLSYGYKTILSERFLCSDVRSLGNEEESILKCTGSFGHGLRNKEKKVQILSLSFSLKDRK